MMLIVHLLNSNEHIGLHSSIERTFIDKQDKSKVAKLHNCRLNAFIKPFPTWRAPSNTDEDLSDETAIYKPVQGPVDKI